MSLNANPYAVVVTDPAKIAAAHKRAIELGFSVEAKTDKFVGLNTLALSRLAVLPEPTDITLDDPERYAQSAWKTTDKFTYDPERYTAPVLTVVNLHELLGTDPNLSRKTVERHITSKALNTNGHYALVVAKNGDKIIVDGHHRLMAQWLLGHPTAQVWLVEEK